ncbi:hypothetical protein L798_01315 [Zootermopsis nevadensis]|uniref:ALMS motif domain-containing protein n=2 Tax=Zootermopsis nevadensis TaxID=136037 RepID=A0A067QWT5_ZOONE|nr:hypothetical protein L798_01315 [Zootermopsis nevadensis]
MNCGLQKDCNERKEKQIDFGSTSNNTSTTQKSPIGYILTLETSTDPVSSMAERSEKKMLEEIKIKVPERKNHLISAKGKRRKKFQKAVLKSSMKFSKENHKSVTSMEDRSFPEDELQRNKCREEHTLQEYLMARRPDFIQNAEYRRQCLHELAYLRELRQESRQLLALASHIPHFNGDNTASVNIGPLPQSPMAIKRIFSQHTMRAQTERKYRSLPEVLSKKAEKKKKEDFRTNRLMAEIFARKLQRRVLKGDVNLSNSRSVISVI